MCQIIIIFFFKLLLFVILAIYMINFIRGSQAHRHNNFRSFGIPCQFFYFGSSGLNDVNDLVIDYIMF